LAAFGLGANAAHQHGPLLGNQYAQDLWNKTLDPLQLWHKLWLHGAQIHSLAMAAGRSQNPHHVVPRGFWALTQTFSPKRQQQRPNSGFLDYPVYSVGSFAVLPVGYDGFETT
jgi:hypothetical protein